MRIAFNTHGTKTIFFHRVAQRLEAAGHEVFWLTPSHEWAQWLVKEGAREDRILAVTNYGFEWTGRQKLTEEELQNLTRLEQDNQWTINNIILMDRFLSAKPRHHALAYLGTCEKYVRKFLLDNQIQICLSEATVSLDLLTIQICKALGIRSYVPLTVRIPSDRFAFFEGHLQSNVAFIRKPTDRDRQQAEIFYAHYIEKNPKPRYFYLNNKIPKPKFSWIGKLLFRDLLAGQDAFTETRVSTRALLRLRIGEVWNAWAKGFTRLFETPRLPAERPFVLYTMHKQPEASIDVLGSYFSNQFELIKAMARSIPVTHDLYVKEHSNAMGDRSISFYKKLRRIPAVRVINPYADSHLLVKHADLAISVSGTICYEAGLLGIPAMTVSPMFFGPLLHSNGFNPYDGVGARTILNFLSRRDRGYVNRDDAAKRIEFLTFLHAQSFVGNISDPVADPTCVEEDNIDRVSEAVSVLVRSEE